MTEKPVKPAVTALPPSALFHFALSLDEYSATRAAVEYFANKLRNPRQKEIAQRALAKLDAPTGVSVPSETSAVESGAVTPAEAMPKGLNGMGKKSGNN